MTDIERQSVLIVDDSEDIHHLVSARLSSERVNMLHAYNAAGGLEMIRQHQPDLVLLDLDMPGTDGMTLCQRIKEQHELANIPVIFLTGTLDVETKVQAFELGAMDYVTKPFDAVELRARVRSALRLKRYHDLLTTKAQIDALTGLWNRGYFDNQLAIELSVLERKGVPVSVAMVDVDHFKAVNDTHGHLFGDMALQAIAGQLSQVCRDSDVVCRYGGEEFTVILRDTAHRGAILVAERMREAIAGLELKTGRRIVPITASIGIGGSDEFRDETQLSPEALMERADQALYQAKEKGRNRVE